MTDTRSRQALGSPLQGSQCARADIAFEADELRCLSLADAIKPGTRTAAAMFPELGNRGIMDAPIGSQADEPWCRTRTLWPGPLRRFRMRSAPE